MSYSYLNVLQIGDNYSDGNVKKVITFLTSENGRLDIKLVDPLPVRLIEDKTEEWASWSYKNWGCKWVDNCTFDGVNILQFNTGNGDGKNFVMKLSKKFPEILFTHLFQVVGYIDYFKKEVIKNATVVEAVDGEWNDFFPSEKESGILETMNYY